MSEDRDDKAKETGDVDGASPADVQPDGPQLDEPQSLAIDGILDLHTFAPREVKELVPVWLEACRDEGLRDVRIIHGKGIGVLRTIVQGILAQHPAVESFGLAGDSSSWGATVARLRPKE